MKKTMILMICLSLAPMAHATSLPSLHPAAEGCQKVLSGEFEDGASYYKAIGELIVAPLEKNPENRALARFLSDALIVSGHMSLTPEICESLNQSAISHAQVELSRSFDLDPVSLVCSNGKSGTDSDFQVEIFEDALVFYPYESSFTVKSFSTQASKLARLHKFNRIPVTFSSEGTATPALVSGTISTNGEQAQVNYDLELKAEDSMNFSHKDLSCHKRQVVRVNPPTGSTESNCLKGTATCLYLVSGFYELVDDSAVKRSSKLSMKGCAAEGVACMVDRGQFYALEIPNIEFVIWE